MPRRILKGFVVSSKSEKTIIVKVERSYMHPRFKKIVNMSKKYSAHVNNNSYIIGDEVKIMETAPISKTKKWIVLDS